MNLVLLLGALLPWAATPAGALFRVYAAVAILSVEMQIAAWSGTGTLYTLPLLNGPLAVAMAIVQWRRGRWSAGWVRDVVRVAPWPLVVALAGLVVALNLLMPLQAADPYHLERIAQIEQAGRIEYDPAAEPKVNVMGWVYELVLADLRRLPGIGEELVRLHGVLALGLYLIGFAAVRGWVGPAAVQWPWTVVLVVPVVFHAFVLIKNDLFIAMAAFPALAWVIARVGEASLTAIGRAASLTGFVVGVKLTNVPLTLILACGVVAGRLKDWRRPLAAAVVGTVIGAAAGGLFFTLQQNAKWYGDPLATNPVSEMGNMTRTPAEAALSVFRFAISLVDLGLVTPRIWPGRGGWGGTFGLPFIWAAIVLLAHVRHERTARWVLAFAALHFVAFAAVFPDADVAHRLALTSCLLAIAGAADIASRHARYARTARLTLIPVLLLSAAQITRSAVLYLSR